MRIGDLIMIGDRSLIIVDSKWSVACNEWYWAIAPIDDPSDGTWLPEDVVLHAWKDYKWWTKNVLDNNIRNGYIIDNKGG